MRLLQARLHARPRRAQEQDLSAAHDPLGADRLRLGYTLEDTAARLKKKTHRHVSPSTITTWLEEYQQHCSYRRLRTKAGRASLPAKPFARSSCITVKSTATPITGRSWTCSAPEARRQTQRRHHFAKLADFLESRPNQSRPQRTVQAQELSLKRCTPRPSCPDADRALAEAVVDETLSHNPSAAFQRARLLQYASELVVSSVIASASLPRFPGGTGAVAVAALALVPSRGSRRGAGGARFVLGGTVAILALMLVPSSSSASRTRSRSRSRDAPPDSSRSRSPSRAGSRSSPAPCSSSRSACSPASRSSAVARRLRLRAPPRRPGGGDLVRVRRRCASALVAGLVLARDRPARAVRACRARRGPLRASGRGRTASATGRALNPTDPDALSPALVAQLKRLPPGAVVIAAPMSYGSWPPLPSTSSRRRSPMSRHARERPEQRGSQRSTTGSRPATRRSRAGTVPPGRCASGRLIRLRS